VRGPGERESLDAIDVAAAIKAAQSAVPGAPDGLSTGAWILQNTKLRHEKISAWKIFPDFASVKFKEDGAIPLAELLLFCNAPIEGGVADLDGTKIFIASGFAHKCMRLLIEPLEPTLEAAIKTLGSIENLLDEANIKIPRVPRPQRSRLPSDRRSRPPHEFISSSSSPAPLELPPAV
jgi:uncharacterized protein (DUF849 family)